MTRRAAKPRRPIALKLADPNRRVVVLVAALDVEDRANPLPAGTVVEAADARFAGLHIDHVRPATERDVAIAGSHLVRLDLPDTDA